LAPSGIDSQNEVERKLLQPVVPLLHSFAAVVGLQMKLCGCDGNPIADGAVTEAAGPCAVFLRDGVFPERCAGAHSSAIRLARSLRRPYIFTCHSRLAAWAIPILHEEKTLQTALICGGALLMKPDAALARHLEEIAIRQGIESRVLIDSLNHLAVVSRGQFRSVAAFLLELIPAVISRPAMHAPAPVAAPAFTFVGPEQASLVFPPEKRKEPKKERACRDAARRRDGAEKEIIRLLHERRQDDALRALNEYLQPANRAAGDLQVPRADAAEMFARMLRVLLRNRRAPRQIQEQQAALLKDALGLTRGPEGKKRLVRLCEQFVCLAGELACEPRPRQVKAIQGYIEKNLSKKLTLATVGARFGLKEKPLNALIVKHCGTGFTDYVISLRVSEAKRLLRTTDLNLGEIAAKTGFSDQSYFTKIFKATVGTTPSKFKSESHS